MANGRHVTVQLDGEVITAIQKDLAIFSRAADSLRKRLSRLIPASYGSDTWWEEKIERSRNEEEQGKYKTFDSMEDLVRHMDTLS